MTTEQLLQPEEPKTFAAAPSGPSRRRWLQILLLVIIFVSGGVVGVGGTVVAVRKHWVHLWKHPENVPKDLVTILQEKLTLSPEQTQDVDRIVKARHGEMEKLRAEVQPRYEQEFKKMETEVDAVLNPDQKERWHEWVSNVKRRWGPGGPPHHRPRHRQPGEHSRRSQDQQDNGKQDKDKPDQTNAAEQSQPKDESPAKEPATQ